MRKKIWVVLVGLTLVVLSHDLGLLYLAMLGLGLFLVGDYFDWHVWLLFCADYGGVDNGLDRSFYLVKFVYYDEFSLMIGSICILLFAQGVWVRV